MGRSTVTPANVQELARKWSQAFLAAKETMSAGSSTAKVGSVERGAWEATAVPDNARQAAPGSHRSEQFGLFGVWCGPGTCLRADAFCNRMSTPGPGIQGAAEGATGHRGERCRRHIWVVPDCRAQWHGIPSAWPSAGLTACAPPRIPSVCMLRTPLAERFPEGHDGTAASFPEATATNTPNGSTGHLARIGCADFPVIRCCSAGMCLCDEYGMQLKRLCDGLAITWKTQLPPLPTNTALSLKNRLVLSKTRPVLISFARCRSSLRFHSRR